jgi:hypothetical protein
MHRRFQKFLPIVLIALVVQILAPIGATWMVAVAAADPLGAATICHSDPAAPAQNDQGGSHRSHDGACAVCCAAQVGASVDTPKTEAVAAPYRVVARVIWRDEALDVVPDRPGSNAQARGPPSVS